MFRNICFGSDLSLINLTTTLMNWRVPHCFILFFNNMYLSLILINIGLIFKYRIFFILLISYQIIIMHFYQLPIVICCIVRWRNNFLRYILYNNFSQFLFLLKILLKFLLYFFLL